MTASTVGGGGERRASLVGLAQPTFCGPAHVKRVATGFEPLARAASVRRAPSVMNPTNNITARAVQMTSSEAPSVYMRKQQKLSTHSSAELSNLNGTISQTI